jgi:hypothetical protein
MIEFEASDPITFFVIAARKANELVFEGYGTLFVQKDLNIKLKTPEIVEPKTKVTININSNEKADAYVLVKPKVTSVNYASDKIPSALKDAVKETILCMDIGFAAAHTSFGTRSKSVMRGGMDMLYAASAPLMDEPLLGATLDMEDNYTLTSAVNVNALHVEELTSDMSSYIARDDNDDDIDSLLTSLECAVVDELEEIVLDRKDNNSVIFADVISLEEGDNDLVIDNIEDIGELEICVLALQGYSWVQEKTTILCDKEHSLLVSFPPIVSETKNISKAFVVMNSKRETHARVTHFFNDVPVGSPEMYGVFSPGESFFIDNLTQSGTYRIEMLDTDDNTVLDSMEFEAELVTRDVIQRSLIHLLKPQDTLSGKLTLMPSYADFGKEVAEALYAYPHGCAEQTLSGLKGNGTLYRAFKEGSLEESKGFTAEELKQKMKSGIARVAKYQQEQFYDYVWGHFDRSWANLDISAQCLMHMQPFYDNIISEEFPEIQTWIEGTVERLLEDKYKDNRLVWAHPNFKQDEIESPEDAAALSMYLNDENAYKWLMDNAIVEDGKMRWEGGRSYAGNLQTNAFCARAIYRRNKEAFTEAWNSINDKVENGRYFSTCDSVELISLMMDMDGSSRSIIKADGKEINTQELKKPLICSDIEVIEGEPMVKDDRMEEVDYLSFSNKEPGFKVEGLVDNLGVGRGLKLKVQHESNSTSLVARVVTTGGVIFTNGNAKQLKKEVPLINGEAKFELASVEIGDSELFVMVYDLYKKENVEIMPIHTLTIEE